MLRYRLKQLMADREFQEGRHLTLAEISEATGIHRSTLSKIANNRVLNLETIALDQLCSYFNVPIQELVEHLPGKSLVSIRTS